MQSTAALPALATLRAALAAVPALPPPDLLATFATVPDPRRGQGTRFALPALLTLAVTALLSNHLSVLAIAEWGASQPDHVLLPLGFPDGSTPHQSTLHRLFRRLDPVALTTALSRGFDRATAPPHLLVRGGAGVAIDGKAQRGRLAFDHGGSPVHALSAITHDTGVVLAQLPVTVRGDKAEAELTVAPALIARLDWQARVRTGDGLSCQRKVCEQVLRAGGDYLLVVKDNQPSLHADLRLLFDPPSHTLPRTDRREAMSLDYGHGRHHEVRRMVASTDRNGYRDWPRSGAGNAAGNAAGANRTRPSEKCGMASPVCRPTWPPLLACWNSSRAIG